MATNGNGKQRDPELHKMHRSRVKDNFRASGLKGFQDHNILEMLLFYAIPRIDTNEIAHRLINRFGSLHKVFDADISELQTVDGIGLEAATLIKFFPEVFKAYELSKNTEHPCIFDSKSASKYLSGHFVAATEEIMVVLFLDSQGRPIRTFSVSQYKQDEVGADLSVIMKLAAIENAKAIVLAHNHISGFAIPSNNDIEFTVQLIERCKALDIAFCDHIIFANNDICYLSKDKKMLKRIKRGSMLFE